MAQEEDGRAPLLRRRELSRSAAAGGLVAALGGWYLLDDNLTRSARAQRLPDGRPRLPPGQRVISSLRPMGGRPGPAAPSRVRLRIHGEVERPFELSFAELLRLEQANQRSDVHCVTGWSLLGASWRGVSIRALAERAGVRRGARYAILEAAHGYTANVPLAAVMTADALIAHRFEARPLARRHGGPLRALIPSLYFWKSAKWFTGIRFVRQNQPGYWERRGYHDHGDPWREQRFA